MGEHVDTRQMREKKAKKVKKPSSKSDFYDEAPRKKPKSFKQFINEKNNTYDPEDGIEDDEEFRGIKIK